jgi:nucleotide-binding universal stress UspA family protein
MNPVKIVVPLAGSGRDRLALQTAFAAAAPFAAHVVALFVHADPREAIPYGELSLAPDIMQDLIDTAADLEQAASKAARAALATLADEASIRIVGAPQKSDAVTVSFAEMRGRLSRALDRAARLCDLVVFPPVRETDDAELQDGFLRVLTRLQRPVLLSAEKPPKHIARKVALGWDGSTACTHALTASLPYLAQAEEIAILCVADGTLPGETVHEAVEYLALNGLSCTRQTIARQGRSVAQALLDRAAEGGFDLLIAGGYGHGRLLESIFGGVTEHIVSHSAIPVFLTH